MQPDLVVHALRASTTGSGAPEDRAGRREVGRQRGAAAPGGAPAAPRGARRARRARRRATGSSSGRCPSSRHAISARLEQELREALRADPGRMPGGDTIDGRRARGRRARRRSSVIELYRNMISPLRLPSCRFTPTCSQYAVDALAEYGLIRGELAGGGAAGEVRSVASWRMGSDTRDDPDADRAVTPTLRSESLV